MQIFSPVFNSGDFIPQRYTCEGEDVSIPLTWQVLPQAAVSLALIMDDPDAPGATWVHWLVYKLPVSLPGLPEGVPPDPLLTQGGLHGLNSWGRLGYGGPCPPSGVHRYFFKLFALDALLEIGPGLAKEALLASMREHVLQEAQLIGLYQRSRQE